MMMKKTTSALAVAALLGTGAASAATFQIDDNTTFGVSGRVSPFYSETEAFAGATETTGQQFSVDAGTAFSEGVATTEIVGVQTVETGFADREVTSQSSYGDTSRVIFDGSHTLNNGLTGFVNLELRTQGTINNDGTDEDQLEARNAFIGIEGENFGRATFGRQTTVYDAALGGYQDISFFSGTSTASNTGNVRMFRYSTPSLNGLTLHGGMQVNGDTQEAGANDSDSSFSAAAVYNGANFTLSVAYDQAAYIDRAAQGVEIFADSTAAIADGRAYSVLDVDNDGAVDATDVFFTDAIAADTSDEEIVGAAFATNLGGVDVALFSQVDGSQDVQNEISSTGLNLGYSVGSLALAAVVQNIDDETQTILADNSVVEAGSRTEVLLQSVYSLSDQMVIVGEYLQADRRDDTGDTLAIGAVYNF
jgi:predicted porin